MAFFYDALKRLADSGSQSMHRHEASRTCLLAYALQRQALVCLSRSNNADSDGINVFKICVANALVK
jgi:hypothetical protein